MCAQNEHFETEKMTKNKDKQNKQMAEVMGGEVYSQKVNRKHNDMNRTFEYDFHAFINVFVYFMYTIEWMARETDLDGVRLLSDSGSLFSSCFSVPIDIHRYQCDD